MHTLNLLLDGIFLGLSVQHGTERVHERIKACGCLCWCEGNETHEHESTDGADIVIVGKTGNNAVVEGANVEEVECTVE